MDVYFMLWVKIQSYHIYFIAQIVPVENHWVFSVGSCDPLTHPHYYLFIFWVLFYILAWQNTHDSSCMTHLASSMPLHSLCSTGKSFQNHLLVNPFPLEIRNLLRCRMGFRMTVIPIAQLAPAGIILIFSLGEIGGFLE